MAIKQQVIAEIEPISPADATQYLNKESMPVNRKMSQDWVEELARRMTSGQWNPKGYEPIHFDTNNHLINGQHRLRALTLADMTIEFLVIRNCSPDAIFNIDTGRGRSLGTFLELQGEQDGKVLAGTIGMYSHYLKTGYVQKVGGRGRDTIKESMVLLDEHPGLRESNQQGMKINRFVRGGGSRWGVLHYIFTSLDPEDADGFFEHLVSGTDLSAGDPILALRKRLQDHALNPHMMQSREHSAIIIKTWNHYRAGTQIERVTWKGGGIRPEAFPEPI